MYIVESSQKRAIFVKVKPTCCRQGEKRFLSGVNSLLMRFVKNLDNKEFGDKETFWGGLINHIHIRTARAALKMFFKAAFFAGNHILPDIEKKQEFSALRNNKQFRLHFRIYRRNKD